MLFGKIFYMIHRTISVRFLRDTIRGDEDINLRVPSFRAKTAKSVKQRHAWIATSAGLLAMTVSVQPPRDEYMRATSSR